VNPWGVTVPPPTEAELFNAARPTAFLLVEGGSDERFWLARVDPRLCQVRAAGGRDTALGELRTVRREGKGGFVAVLDADFDRVEATLQDDPDIVWTDLHDLELTLIASPALDKVLVEACSRTKREKLEAEEGCHVRDALLARGLEPARLRWLSRREGLALTFRKLSRDGTFQFLDYSAFCPRATWKLDVVELVNEVIHFSSQHRLKPQARDLMRRMRSLPDVDAWQLCVGHDLVGLLAVGLRSKLGNRTLTIEDLQERLRLAFERGHLEATAMFAALRRWERDHPPFRIFVT
jgi:hypothetical protein